MAIGIGKPVGVVGHDAATYTWRRTWADEFDYTGTPDPTKWRDETGKVRNNDAQDGTNLAENASVM